MDAVARVRASVHTKLLAGFLVGALLLLGMGILSMVVLNRMSGQVEELTALQERSDRSRQMIYLVTAQSHFRAMALLTSDDIWNNKVADAKTAFVAHIDASSADPRTGQQAEFAAITVINDHYAASGEGVLALYESGSFDGALGLHITEEHDISHELEDVLNEVIDESTAEMIAASADFRSDRDGLRFAVVAFSGVSLLTAILLGVVLSGTFVRPLRASNATLALIGEGDFTQRLEVANRDEFGTLSENINRTSEDLSSLWGELNALNANLQQTVDEQVEELLAQREAIQRERSRIARELHDVVGSSLSVMVVQSQAAAAALDDDPSIARSALKTIAESGRTTAGAQRTRGVARTGARGGAPGRAGGRRGRRTAASRHRPLLLPDRAGGAHKRSPARRGAACASPPHVPRRGDRDRSARRRARRDGRGWTGSRSAWDERAGLVVSPDPPNPRPDSAAGTRKQVPL